MLFIFFLVGREKLMLRHVAPHFHQIIVKLGNYYVISDDWSVMFICMKASKVLHSIYSVKLIRQSFNIQKPRIVLI